MLYLHQYPPIWGLPSLSPFCIKVETYLRMINLPYKIVIENDPRKGPKGKMPVLKDGTKIIADSSFIIEYLQDKYHIAIDEDLTVQQQATQHAFRKMIEENLYFIILYSRWIDPVGKEYVDNAFRRFFPKPLAGFALKWIRRNLNKQAYFQGIGRHTRDEIYALGNQDITALQQLLGNNTHMLGENIHTLDTTAYAFLITILQSGFDNPLKDNVKKHTNLVDYCMRLKDKYFFY